MLYIKSEPWIKHFGTRKTLLRNHLLLCGVHFAVEHLRNWLTLLMAGDTLGRGMGITFVGVSSPTCDTPYHSSPYTMLMANHPGALHLRCTIFGTRSYLWSFQRSLRKRAIKNLNTVSWLLTKSGLGWKCRLMGGKIPTLNA